MLNILERVTTYEGHNRRFMLFLPSKPIYCNYYTNLMFIHQTEFLNFNGILTDKLFVNLRMHFYWALIFLV